MSLLRDEDLLAATASRPAAFAEFYRRHERLVLAYLRQRPRSPIARRRCGGWPVTTAAAASWWRRASTGVARNRLVCVYVLTRIGAGGICEEAADLLARDRPSVLPIGTGPIVLVRNDVARVWLELADGSQRTLTPRNNIAVGRGDNACHIRWLRADGSGGRAPVDGAPPERCG